MFIHTHTHYSHEAKGKTLNVAIDQVARIANKKKKAKTYAG